MAKLMARKISPVMMALALVASVGSIILPASPVKAATIPMVAAGHCHTVGLKSDGTVLAVGWNSSGQCNVSSWTNITQVAAGYVHTVGLKSNGTVVAVGDNGSGRCNVGSWTDVTQVDAGAFHTVGLKSDGTVVAVGDNVLGQCNVGSWTGITQISAGYYHTVGLRSDGTVVAIGQNTNGECNVDSWTNIIQVSGGTFHTVGLKADGTVVAVGLNDYGQCNVDSWAAMTQVSAGRNHTLGLKSDGTVAAVGRNDSGQCNVGSWANIIQISAGLVHTAGLKSDGTVVAVGQNTNGECNVGSWINITQVSAGYYHNMGLKTDGTVLAEGRNDYGQCNTDSWTGITQVVASGGYTVGVKSDGTVLAIGYNLSGQCNTGPWTDVTQVDASGVHTAGRKSNGTAVAVGYNGSGQCNVESWTNIAQVAAGFSHTVGLKSDRTVVAVGSNSAGQCNVSSWTDIIQVAAGDYHTVGLKSDGTVVAVGNNSDGRCNTGSWIGITQVDAGPAHTVGLKSDGTVLAVGSNGSDRCNTGSWTGITQVSAGWEHTVGLGSVVAVGKNDYSQCHLFDWRLGAVTTVTTDAATGITISSATLNMRYAPGNYGSIDVRFAYKKAADNTWTYTPWVAKSAPGTHAELLTGLDFNTQYSCKAQLRSGSTQIEGNTQQFTTGTTPPTVTTNDATDIGTSSATLNGNLNDLGTAPSINSSFQWGTASGGPYPNQTIADNMTAAGPFTFALGNLTPNSTYYFIAKADGGAHGTSFGAEQSFTTSSVSYPIPTFTGTGTATFSSDQGNITGLTAVDENTLPTEGKPAGVTFPHGLFSFNITGIAPGSTVTVTITLPSALPVGTQYWKCQNGQWIDCTSLLGHDNGDNILTLTLTDGSLGDADGQANGTIVDPGGPGPIMVISGRPTYGGAEGAATGESQSTTLHTANLRIAMMLVNPSQAKANQPITISANVVNAGSETSSTRVNLKINGQLEQTKMVTVGGGSSRLVKFTVTKAEPGNYTAIMGSQRASFLVTEDTAVGINVDGGVIAIMLPVLLAAAVVIVLAFSFPRQA